MNTKKTVSLVIPCYNEAAVIEQTAREVLTTLGNHDDFNLEVIFVNDGSDDNTLPLLRHIQQQDNRVKVLHFSRNFGQQNAMTAGIDHASGDAVVLMDADLQDPPAVILGFIEKWREGYEMVYGVRGIREGETPLKLITAKFFYRFFNCLSDVPIPLDTGDFRLMDRKVIEAIKQMPEHDRFLKGMVAWVGFKQYAYEYARGPRVAGKTKYSFLKLTRFALSGIVSFSTEPLRIPVYLSFIAIGIALMATFYTCWMRLFHGIPTDPWIILAIIILLMSGFQLFSFGIIGEYLGRIYHEGKKRPKYLIAEKLGFTETQASGNTQSPAVKNETEPKL